VSVEARLLDGSRDNVHKSFYKFPCQSSRPLLLLRYLFLRLRKKF
jgi:hypothetical protein